MTSYSSGKTIINPNQYVPEYNRATIACGVIYALAVVPAIHLAARKTQWLYRGRKDVHTYRTLLAALWSLLFLCVSAVVGAVFGLLSQDPNNYDEFGNNGLVHWIFLDILYNLAWPTVELCTAALLWRITAGLSHAIIAKNPARSIITFRGLVITTLVILLVGGLAAGIFGALTDRDRWQMGFLFAVIEATYNGIYLVLCVFVAGFLGFQCLPRSTNKRPIRYLLLSLLALSIKSIFLTITDLLNVIDLQVHAYLYHFNEIVVYPAAEQIFAITYAVIYPLCLVIALWLIVLAGTQLYSSTSVVADDDGLPLRDMPADPEPEAGTPPSSLPEPQSEHEQRLPSMLHSPEPRSGKTSALDQRSELTLSIDTTLPAYSEDGRSAFKTVAIDLKH